MGFTLVELSIVIVVIGLIVAVVTAGSSIVRQAQLRKTITQVNQIKAAYNSYRLQYNALPGDHNQATNYWGTAGDCTAVTPSTTATCNGDGNKHLAYLSIGGDTGNFYEPYLFWKHLANSGLYKGKQIDHRFEGPFSDAGWFAMSSTTCPSCVNWIGRVKNPNRDLLSLTSLTGNWYDPPKPPLTPQEQNSIDTKLDDGMAYLGHIVSISNYAANCATSADETVITSTYNLTYTNKACVMFVDLD